MAREQRLEVTDHRAVAAERELGVDVVLDRAQPKLVQSHCFGGDDFRIPPAVRERVTSPQGESGCKLRVGGPRVAVGEGATAGPGMPLEPSRVDVLGVGSKEVARFPRDEHPRKAGSLEPPPDPGNVSMDGLDRGGWRVLTPETVDELGGRHDLVDPQGEEGEQEPFLRGAEEDRPRGPADLEGAQERQLHGASVGRSGPRPSGPRNLQPRCNRGHAL